MKTRRGSDIPLETPEWAWPGVIPHRAITLIVGPSKIGKSTLAAKLAADWTTGALTGKPEDVLMLMTEDIDGYTTIPRVKAHGGKDKRVHTLEESHVWSLPDDLDLLRETIVATGVRIVIMDPLQQFVRNLSGQEGRETLGAVKTIAEELGVSIIFLHHFIKSTRKGMAVWQAIAGGYGVYGVARSVLILGWEPINLPASMKSMFKAIFQTAEDDEESPEEPDEEVPGQKIVLAHEKNSWGPLHPSILLSRQSVPHPANPKDPSESVSILAQVSQVKYTAHEVMCATGDDDGKEDLGSPREQAQTAILWLLTRAGEQGMKASELENRAKTAGFAATTVQRARKALADEHLIVRSQTKDSRGLTSEHRWRLNVPDSPSEL